MIIDKFKSLPEYKCLFVLFWISTVCVCLRSPLAGGVDRDAEIIGFSAFHTALSKRQQVP